MFNKINDEFGVPNLVTPDCIIHICIYEYWRSVASLSDGYKEIKNIKFSNIISRAAELLYLE